MARLARDVERALKGEPGDSVESCALVVCGRETRSDVVRRGAGKSELSVGSKGETRLK